MIEFTTTTKEQWRTIFDQFPEANFLQSWGWGDVQSELGHTVIRLAIFENRKPAGLISGIVRNAKRGRYLEIPGGPLIDWSNQQLARQTTDKIQELGRDHRCVFVRFRPQQPDSGNHREQLAKLGAVLSPMHLAADHTSVINITKSPEELLKNMRQQTRYEVRRADKQDITVSWSRDDDAIALFHKTQAETAARQGFIPPSAPFLQACMNGMGKSARLYKAEKDGRLLNLGLVFFYGNEAVYYEAASTPEARKLPGAYAVIWRAIQDAQALDIARFNLWGIAPPDRPNHRFTGVTTFKRGFGGEDVSFVPAHDFVLSKPRYSINKMIEEFRKKKRGL